MKRKQNTKTVPGHRTPNLAPGNTFPYNGRVRHSHRGPSMRAFFLLPLPALLLALPAPAQAPPGPPPTLLLPLVRTAYQTNERIALAVVRPSGRPTRAGRPALPPPCADGGKLSFPSPPRAAPLTGREARRTEHLHVNAALLRPGKYTIE